VSLKTLRTAGKILTDIAASKSTEDASAGDIVFKHVIETV